MEATTTDLPIRWHNTLFSVRRSIRYHQRRRSFYDRLDKTSNMLSLIFGSAAIYGVLQKDYQAVALIASAIVTIASSVNLVVGSAQRGRDHTDFMRKYVELEKSMLCDDSDEVLLQVQETRLSIEAEEPPVMHVLNAICHNELMRAMGYPKKELPKIGWLQTWVAQVFDFCESSIQAPKSKRKCNCPTAESP
ncbi:MULTISPECIES: hypothetical protein [Pseudomonas]|uniref:hypothetical protein n=1 Tax=Pseudomonas TaxID=286 RepID=UPI0006940226|nr:MULTISPECIES: hypothetical protein [Pseudomonas]AMT90087.1 hypothetical protein AYO71_22000 [Pseudomonas koreensis]MBB4057346.1 hypothetical protein [Pseudomonas koreensis]TSB50309.1 hypothetical protein FEE99_19785 [Pseudomonas sp. ef1]